MIIVDDVYKRYRTDHGMGKWVLQGVSFTIPPKTNVGLIGRNGAGKSTLLRIIGGVDNPNRGKVERLCRVSWPMGFGGGLQGSLTGRQNAKFICRIHGHYDDIPERLAEIQAFAELGEAFDEPVKTYSSGMRSRLQFALSLAFDFDVYISDEVTSTGDAGFKKKASDAFKRLIGRAGLIMVSHGEGILKEFCTAGIWLDNGKAYWFDNLDDALKAYRESLGVQSSVSGVQAQKPAAAKTESTGVPTHGMGAQVQPENTQAKEGSPQAKSIVEPVAATQGSPVVAQANKDVGAPSAPAVTAVNASPVQSKPVATSANAGSAAQASPADSTSAGQATQAKPATSSAKMGAITQVVAANPNGNAATPALVTPGKITRYPKLAMFSTSLDILARGIDGMPMEIKKGEAKRIVRHASKIGLKLLAEDAIMAKGFRVEKNAGPILLVSDGKQRVPLYDLHTQCVKVEK